MHNDCEICSFSENTSTDLLTTERWRVGLGNNQAYFGRAYVSLKVHKQSLSELDVTDWLEFKDIVQRLEKAYKIAFGADPLNWGCYMNHAYRVNPANPHVHWHIYPRYRQAPTFEGHEYKDPNYGEMYDHLQQHFVDDAAVARITAELKQHA